MAQPTYSSANGYVSEHFFTIVFDTALDAANPPPTSAFSVQVNGTTINVTGVSVDGPSKAVKVTLAGNALTAGDYIAYTYTDPSNGNDANAIQGTDGVDAATFSTNYIVQGPRPGPAAPATPALSSGSDSGTAGDGITNVDTPTLSGTAAANATIKLFDTDGTTQLGITTADGSGNWSITSSQLSEGSHTLKVTQTDASNVTSPLSAGLSLTIDKTALAPTSLALTPGSDSGTLGDGITNVTAPTVKGNAEANAAVRLYDTDGTTLLGSATADGAGHWSIHSSNLVEGVHTLTTKQTDVAGNVSVASTGFAVQVDTIGPTGMALSNTSVSQSSATNGSTVATLSANDASAITYGFQTGNGTIDADNGKFTINGNQFVAAQNLTAGTYHVYLKATDAAGNDAYQIFALDVVNGPSVSSILRADQPSGTVPANANSVAYTVTFSEAVTGLDSSDFTLTSTGSASGSIASVTGSGAVYTVNLSGLGGDGSVRLDLKSSGTGIVNGSSEPITGGYTSGQVLTLDHTAPASPSAPAMSAGSDTGVSNSDAVTNNATPVFTGTSEANAVVRLYDTDGTTLLGTATASGSGQWSIASSTLASGPHSLTVKQTDAAGNVSNASSALSVVIDTTVAAPGKPVLSTASDSGALGDGLTNVYTPTITGTAEAFADITLFDTDGLTVLGTGVANGLGAWSIVSSPLNDGVHTLTARQIDPAGNVSTSSAGLTLTLDTLIPFEPSIPTLSLASDSGTKGDGITNVSTPVFTGGAEANARVVLLDTDGITVLGTAVADGSGHWSITSSALALGAHSITARQTDVAGNVSYNSSELSLTIEAAPTPPGSPVTTTSIDGVSVTQQQIVLAGGLSGTQVVVPIVDNSRVDSSGNASVADIPLVSSSGTALLTAQLAPGFGLSAKGGVSLAAGSSTDHLIQAILAATPGHAPSDQGHLTGNGVTFLNKLSASVPLLVETITPEGGSANAAGALTLTGTSNASQHTALVIDATHLANGSSLVLNNVDFAAIVGSVNVLGTTQGQILTGDAASQQFSVASNLGSSVFAGDGNDSLNLTAAMSDPAQPSVSTTLLHGGKGSDTLSFSGSSNDYLVQQHEGYTLVTSKSQPDQQTLVINAEKLSFSDQSLTIQASEAQTELSGLYQSTLGRQADYKGFDYWAVEAKNGVSLGSIALSLITSAEAQGAHPVTLNGNASHDVEALYQGIYNRQSDSAGLAYWVDAMKQGMTLEQVADNFVHATEMVQHKIDAANWDFIV